MSNSIDINFYIVKEYRSQFQVVLIFIIADTFTTQAVRAGIDPQTLKRMLGHADLSTTDKYYTHLDLNDILSASKNLL